MARQKSDKELFAEYLSENKIVIADPNSSSRVRLAATLVELGGKRHNMCLAATYEEAQAEIRKERARIVLCEFFLGEKSGLDLLQEQRQEHPEGKSCLFALITADSSQSAVAQAAEEDVDTYILKPYTLEVLKRTLITAAITKLYPSDYHKVVEMGKDQLVRGELDGALQTFERATQLHPKPTLAYFYLGQVHMIKQVLQDAGTKYEKGLSYNKIHYKCLVGLYETLMQMKKFDEAYEIVRRLAQYFPANPRRLASVLRLAIYTKNYDDIEGFYRIFAQLKERPDELIKYICAAMIVTGKHYLGRKIRNRGLELLEKAAVSAAGRPALLRYTIEALMEFNLCEEAKKHLVRFPPQSRNGQDFLTTEYYVMGRALPVGKAIQTGRDLIAAGFKNPTLYRALVGYSIEGKLIEAAEELCREALKSWPEDSAFFQTTLEKLTKSQSQPAAPAKGK